MVNNKALVVGINDYPKSPLSGCINDAKAIGEVLSTNGDGSPNFDVKYVLDVATKAELLEHLHALFAVGDADIALFYFSGHGTNIINGKLVTPDFNGLDSGVSMNDILLLANKSKSKNRIIILDCCFSGKFGENGISNSHESVLANGVTIMTSSGRDEYSVENNDGKSKISHGVFTELLLQGLKGGAADVRGNITPASLYSFVDQSLGPWEQRPLFKTNISSFLPIRYIEPKVPKKVLRKLSTYFADSDSEFKLDPSFEFTNTPKATHELKQPYADVNNIKKFKELQLYESVGLIEPVGEDHMYFAAMNSKSCKLTPLGIHYWKLSKDNRF